MDQKGPKITRISERTILADETVLWGIPGALCSAGFYPGDPFCNDAECNFDNGGCCIFVIYFNRGIFFGNLLQNVWHRLLLNVSLTYLSTKLNEYS